MAWGGGWRESENAVAQRRKVDPCPPSSLPLGQGSIPEVEGGQEGSWQKVEPTEISGRGQKWDFGKVAEGV